MLLIISLSSLSIGVYRDGFSALFPFLQREFNLNRSQIGLHSSFFFLGNMFMGVFSGRLIDLRGSKWGLVYGVLFIGIIIILHSIAPNFIILLLLAVFAGAAVSLNVPAASKGLAELFPKKWRGSALGVMSSALPAGGIFAATLLPFLSILIGWRKVIVLPGVFALLCAFFILRFYKDNKNESDNFNKHSTNATSLKRSLEQLIKNPDMMIISIVGFCWGAINGAIGAHFVLYLHLDYGLAEDIAGLGFAVVQFGSILGRPGWGLICDRLIRGDRKKTFSYMGLLFAILSLVLSFSRVFNLTITVLFLLAFLTGFSGRGWHGLYFTATVESVEEDNIGVAIGFSMLFPRAGLMLAPPIFGYIADRGGSYNLSWIFLGLIALASVMIFYISSSAPFKKIFSY